jgi:two-component system response regulator YesN
MIVDDEPIIRMGLKKIVNWEDYGFKVVCEARDGEDALKLLEEHSIDFIVTDIRMHKITGIELLRAIRERESDIPVLLLSGYDDFSYAQEGIRLGAFDYILKPLDAQKLKNALTNAHKIVSMKAKKNHEFNLNKSISREKILYDLLRGKNLMQMDEYIAKYDLPLVKNKVQVAMVEINELLINSEERIGSDIGRAQEESVHALIERELMKSGIEYFSVVDGDFGKKFVIAQPYEEVEAATFNQSFTEVLSSILKASKEELKNNLNIGVGNPYNQLYSIHKSYLNAKEALKYKYVLGTGRLIHINELSEVRQENFIYPIEKEKALIAAVIQGKDDSLNMAKELIKDIAQVLNFDIFRIKMVFTQIVNSIYNNILSKYNFLADIYGVSQIGKSNFLGLETLQEVEKKLTEDISIFIGFIKEYNLNQGDNIVPRACEYVLNNIEEDITLTSISNNLHISKNYLCSIFKQQTGENFLEYVTKAKMERAKVLLKKYDLKVYEVSDTLGYKETKYFSSLFKKHTGCTPAEYKKGNF